MGLRAGIKTSILVALFFFPVVLHAQTPTKVIEKLHSGLIEVMKEAESLGYEGRYARLEPIISENYDLGAIARVAVGRYWRSFSEEERVKFVDIFSRLSIATYAGRLSSYAGEHFEIDSEEEIKPGMMKVKSRLVKPNSEGYELIYVLYSKKNRWRIVNVIAEGVSDLSLKRADYTKFLKENNFELFMKKLEEKIARYGE